jgi:glycopeptide antibiotics resistance protein
MKKGLRIGYWAILIVYLLLLISIVFMGRDSIRSINVIPFASIKEFIFVDNGVGGIRMVDMNLWGNIVMFIPAGIYIILENANKTISKNIMSVMAASLLIEVVQFVFKRGAFDIDDIILNTLGGIIGIFIYQICKRIFQNDSKIKDAISVLSLIVGTPVLFLAILLMVYN